MTIEDFLKLDAIIRHRIKFTPTDDYTIEDWENLEIEVK